MRDESESIIELARITVCWSLPPQQKSQLKGQILRERIDFGNIPVHCQATTPTKIHPSLPIHERGKRDGESSLLGLMPNQ
jgi:hypothetical protein